ncbi:MAG: ACT domain-containing protein [Oligosphaeraceae bacterium]|mgnify:CR=1 FL=1|nr:ACT domain-containing protein [Oligosphaeraceae bacterium]
MSDKMVISLMARDQVGMVAEIAGVVSRLGGNIEDISQTVTRGYFSMILVVQFQKKISPAAIRSALNAAEQLSDASIGVCELRHVPAPSPPDSDNRYVLTVSGPDRSGLVAEVAGYLRERNINIVDLASLINQGEYTMMFLVDLPPDTDVSKLRNSLQMNLESLSLQVELRHQALFRKTNEI